ncbi:hypothetical protein IW261DRAFT_1416061 [Armillaria novae-zelandiae]|uniref:Uncharacterized protein n=1 Tax=Armillaria novae-zelandiae TaxID=153914 RepID=A0AA39PL35_9AGAR|nr:hypothetical protein IW261DRAFT_1416061 [Armillaria novae-zelandiae]
MWVADGRSNAIVTSGVHQCLELFDRLGTDSLRYAGEELEVVELRQTSGLMVISNREYRHSNGYQAIKKERENATAPTRRRPHGLVHPAQQGSLPPVEGTDSGGIRKSCVGLYRVNSSWMSFFKNDFIKIVPEWKFNIIIREIFQKFNISSEFLPRKKKLMSDRSVLGGKTVKSPPACGVDGEEGRFGDVEVAIVGRAMGVAYSVGHSRGSV